jgi:sugar/nucleoside kinase (ribokinase family)
MRFLRIDENSPYRQLVGIGGLGTGIFFALHGDHTLGRNESRSGRLLNVKDYCKLHIVIHYTAKLLGCGTSGRRFQVIAVGNVGDDAAGKMVRREMTNVGIDTNWVNISAGFPSLFSVCFQYPDGSGGNITTSNSAAGTLNNADVDKLADLMRAGGRRLIALAVPEVPLEVRRHFLQLASRTGAFRAASFVAAEIEVARQADMLELLDLVALNESEAEVLIGERFAPASAEEFARKCQEWISSAYPGLRMILSAGRLGAYGITGEGYDFCPAPKVEVASTAGAGDALFGAVLGALAAGGPFIRTDRTRENSIQSALHLGVLVASYKCQSPDTIHLDASLDTVLQFAADRGFSLSPELEKLFVSDALVQSTT